MNFLSHFYFDRHIADPHQVIGMVLPDLLKNARKDWSLRPEKYEDEYSDQVLLNIYAGWKRHIEVDKYFHCSDFFMEHTKHLRLAIAAFLDDSPARAFFVAHIALELMLDSLLLTENLIETERLYSHLKKIAAPALTRFFQINQIDDPQRFFRFLEEFIKSRYLESYRDPAQIVYALNRICMRIWDEPFNETHKLQLKTVVIVYLEVLRPQFLVIFKQIEQKLTM